MQARQRDRTGGDQAGSVQHQHMERFVHGHQWRKISETRAAVHGQLANGLRPDLQIHRARAANEQRPTEVKRPASVIITVATRDGDCPRKSFCTAMHRYPSARAAAATIAKAGMTAARRDAAAAGKNSRREIHRPACAAAAESTVIIAAPTENLSVQLQRAADIQPDDAPAIAALGTAITRAAAAAGLNRRGHGIIPRTTRVAVAVDAAPAAVATATTVRGTATVARTRPGPRRVAEKIADHHGTGGDGAIAGNDQIDLIVRLTRVSRRMRERRAVRQ